MSDPIILPIHMVVPPGYPYAETAKLRVCRYCPSCPPREAGIQTRHVSEKVDTGKFITIGSEYEPLGGPYIGLEMGFCGVQVWTTASTSGEIHNEAKDEDGVVIASEDWSWHVIWTGSYDRLIAGGGGSAKIYYKGSGDDPPFNATGHLIGQGTESGLTWAFDNPPFIGVYPGNGLSFPLEDYLNNVDWTLGGRQPYTFFRTLAINRLDNVEDEEWEDALYLGALPGTVESTQARLRAQFPPWKNEFGQGIRFAYRIALTTINKSCREDPPISPEITREWLTQEDVETAIVPISEGAVEKHSSVIDDIPGPEDLSGINQVQGKEITITGPSRKLWPILRMGTVHEQYFAHAFQAYDGSKRHYAKETASGYINSSRIAGEEWDPPHPALAAYQATTIAREHAIGYVPPQGASQTSHTVTMDEGDVTFSLSNIIQPNEAVQNVRDQIDGRDPYCIPADPWLPHTLAALQVGAARLSASALKGAYEIEISRPSLPLDGSGTVTAKWKIHTLAANGEKSSEDFSESYTWPARDDEGIPREPGSKTFGPYIVTANEGELKWIEVLEPEEAQHVWPNPIWYVAKGP